MATAESARIRARRFDTLKQTLEAAACSACGGVLDAEQYNPPHRPAAHSPYDAILTLVNSEAPNGIWTEKYVEKFLSDTEIEYDRITGISSNDSRKPGDVIVFLSLKAYEPPA